MFVRIRDGKGDEVTMIVRSGESASGSHAYALTVSDGNGAEKEIVTFELAPQNTLKILARDTTLFPDLSALQQELESLPERIAQALLDNVDFADETFENASENVTPYNPEKIRVEPKSFSIRQIAEMIADGDLDISPDFQRNFVWDPIRKSRLIESILLRIPLPVFYFSMDDNGMMRVVDGLQRLTTIRQFISGGFALQDLEYLKELNGLRFPVTLEQRKDTTRFLNEKYVRRINTTQLSVNVIDATSPAPVKFDIFRRINTGGRPLNSQEMRNCLASGPLRATLNEMAQSEEFVKTTGGSVKTLRMQAQEMALRFMSFRRLVEQNGDFSRYNGQMDRWLDDASESFSRMSEATLKTYAEAYRVAMRNARYLFGRQAFRKVSEKTTNDSQRSIINKALFTAWAVLLSFIPEQEIRERYKRYGMIRPLGTTIDNDHEFARLLSYGTNGWKNLTVSFNEAKEILGVRLEDFRC